MKGNRLHIEYNELEEFRTLDAGYYELIKTHCFFLKLIFRNVVEQNKKGTILCHFVSRVDA